ncbi:hypothetical protein N8376_00050 [Flavobacteriaceae bacterium]|nr:hypothetical protein [Flavobacteriaceae bacterium]MDC1491736.1 hypothetical protein [Flavobacteriaceae bacterium]
MKNYLLVLLTIFTSLSYSQYDIKIKVELDTISNVLKIDQEIQINQSKKKQDLLFLLDWNNSFFSKDTPLAKSFTDEYIKNFHLAKKKERGYTTIKSIKNGNNKDLNFFRLKNNLDVIAVKLDPSNPILKIKYIIKIPSNKFTGYGYTKSKDYYLQYWHLTPAMNLDKWIFYSNKNLNDIPSSKYNITALEIKIPENYQITSELRKIITNQPFNGFKYSSWGSKEVYDPKLYIEKERSYNHLNGSENIFTNNVINHSYEISEKQIKKSNIKVLEFLKNELNINYENKIIISKDDYKDNKIYDLNILPEILKLYPDDFIYELQLLKVLLSKVLDNSLIFNPRKEYWLKDGIQSYMMIDYVEKKYPNIALVGSLSKFPGLKNLYASKLKYNDKYFLSLIHTDRINNTQDLNTPKDSLLKFNEKITNNYKSGLLLYKLSENKKKVFSEIINNSLRLKNNSSVSYFKNELSNKLKYDITYIDSILELKTIDHLDYFSKERKKTNKTKYKPFKIKMGKDIEDPNYNHIYITPIISYKNIYDGVNIGAQIHNKSIFKKEFNYKFKPLYSANSKELSGSAIIYNSKNIRNRDLFMVNYGIYANISSYDQNSVAKIYSPFINLNFRENSNLRENKINSLNARFLKISNNGETNISPEYEIFNLKYTSLKSGLINHNKWFIDYQLSKDFSKISFSYEFRNLFKNNRELNVRLFSGYFLNNRNDSNNYFDFSLDRPSDYLYDYNYYGRSENNGFFSQQIIMAEGGFKSKLIDSNSNNFISTINLSSTIWKNLLLYIDLGILNTKINKSFNFVYDSGIRVNLIADYFEIYFPIKSSSGLEINSPNYNEKIRFLFTFEPDVLLGLFRRKWY